MCNNCAKVVEDDNWRDRYVDDRGESPGFGTSGGQGHSHLFVWCSDGRYAVCGLKRVADATRQTEPGSRQEA